MCNFVHQCAFVCMWVYSSVFWNELMGNRGLITLRVVYIEEISFDDIFSDLLTLFSLWYISLIDWLEWIASLYCNVLSFV